MGEFLNEREQRIADLKFLAGITGEIPRCMLQVFRLRGEQLGEECRQLTRPSHNQPGALVPETPPTRPGAAPCANGQPRLFSPR
jgi:hypothetical protein